MAEEQLCADDKEAVDGQAPADDAEETPLPVGVQWRHDSSTMRRVLNALRDPSV